MTVILAAFLFQLDTSIVNISLPAIAGYYKVSTSAVSYVVLAYLLMVNSTMLLFGKLSDGIGTRPVFLAGSGLFIVGSLLCGLSSTFYMLVVSRCIQGLGGSIILTSAYAVISRFIPAGSSGKAFGILSTASALGLTLGAPIGGLITGLLSWQWIFLIQVPVGVLALATAAHAIPAETREGTRQGSGRHFDLPGAVMSFSGLLALVFFLSMWQELGLSSPLIIGSLIASPVIISIFIVWERKHPNPLVYLKIFENRLFSYSMISRFLSAIPQGGNFFLIPFYLISLKGLRTEHASLIIAIYSVVLMLTSPVGGTLSEKRNTSMLCAMSMLLAMISCTFFIVTLPLNGLINVIIFLMMLAASFGIYYPSNNRMIMGSVPQDSKGIASGIMATIWTLGLLFGVSLFESVFNTYVPHDSVNALTGGCASTETLARGFRNAYFLGAFCCLGTFLCSMITVFHTQEHNSTQKSITIYL